MNYLGSLLVVFNLLFFHLQSLAEKDDHNLGDTIKWSPSYNLTREDFTGTYSTPYLSDPTKDYDTAALSQLNILYEFKTVDRRLKINAYAIFIKDKSFLKSSWG